MPVGSNEAEKLVESLNVAIMDKLVMFFRTAHAISLAGRPFTDFLWITKLDSAKGLDVGKHTSMIKAVENL